MDSFPTLEITVVLSIENLNSQKEISSLKVEDKRWMAAVIQEVTEGQIKEYKAEEESDRLLQ